jgi:hypothetical protein
VRKYRGDAISKPKREGVFKIKGGSLLEEFSPPVEKKERRS